MTFEDDVAHFRTTSWAPLLDSPQWNPQIYHSRSAKDTTEDDLVARIFNSPSTIIRWIGITPKHLKTHSSESASISSIMPTTSANTEFSSSAPVPEMFSLLSLGLQLSGWPRTCHGGAIATIFDEVLGFLIYENQKHIEYATFMTAWLKTSYLRPVPLPADVCVRVWIQKMDGRKLTVGGEMFGGKDSKERVATVEALFIGRKREKL